MEVLRETEAVAARFQRTDGLLKGFLVRLADAHHFADGAHLGPQPVLGAAEFLKRPAGELHHHVVARGSVRLELPLQLGGNGQHGRRAEGVARMDAHGVDVLDETDGDDLIPGVAHDLELEFLPAGHRFLDQDLAHQAGRQPPAGHHAQVLDVIDEAPARSAQRVGGPDHHRIGELRRNPLGLLDAVSRSAAGHVDPQPVHRLLEGDAVFAALDGIHLHADHFDAVLVERPGARQFGAQIQAGLAAQVREQGVRALLLDDLDHRLQV